MNNNFKYSAQAVYLLRITAQEIAKFDKHHRTRHVPGTPSEKDNYRSLESQSGKKVKNGNRPDYEWPANNTPAYGLLDFNQNVWVPSGPTENGGPHWNVENVNGSYTFIFPVKKKLLWSKISDITLVCKDVILCSPHDEDAFFEWIKKIGCIEGLSGSDNTLYLHISSEDIFRSDLDDLLALFYRYNIDMKQLKRFLNNDNKKWFKDGKVKGYWHERVFGD
jgi:hypothetical protein